MKQKIYGRGCQHTACFCQPTILYCIANMQNSWKSSSPREISFKKTFLLQYQHIKNIFFNENVYIVPCNTVLYMYILYIFVPFDLWVLNIRKQKYLYGLNFWGFCSYLKKIYFPLYTCTELIFFYLIHIFSYFKYRIAQKVKYSWFVKLNK